MCRGIRSVLAPAGRCERSGSSSSARRASAAGSLPPGVLGAPAAALPVSCFLLLLRARGGATIANAPIRYRLWSPMQHDVSTFQLDRSDFQSIMGSYEGTFSAAEPAAGDHPRGGW
jgi:hypothetical protein